MSEVGAKVVRGRAVLALMVGLFAAEGCAGPRAQAGGAQAAPQESVATQSASAPAASALPPVSLPRARNVVPLRAGAPVVTVTTGAVLFEGRRVAEVAALASEPQVQRIEGLIGPLQARKVRAGDAFVGSVQIRADERVVFRALMHVLFSLAQAGYGDFEYVVVDERGREMGVDTRDAPVPDPRTGELAVLRVLHVERERYVLASNTGERREIPASEGRLDGEALGRALADLRAQEPELRRHVIAAAVDAPHGEVVAAMDLLVGHGFDQLSFAVSPGDEPVKGALSKEVIRRVIRQNIGTVRACYEQVMNVTGSVFHGQVSVRFVIGPDGAITEAATATNTTGSDPVAACIVEEVGRWRFPEPEGGGIVVVTYPFVLQTEN